MALKESSLLDLFTRSGALLSGHFKLSSGLHSDQYFQCALPLSDPPTAQRLGEALSHVCREAGWEPDLVVSPALGGIIIGHEVARALKTPFLFTERQEKIMILRRGFSLKPGQKVLVIEDVITTGKSTGEVIAVVKSLGAEPIGVASIVIRTEEPPAFGVPVQSLAKIPLRSWKPEQCPLCAQGKPLVKPGSRV